MIGLMARTIDIYNQ